MNIEQLKKKLEPFIRKTVRDEMRKINQKQGIYSDEEMDQVVKNAKKAMDLLGFGVFGAMDKKNKKKTDVEWVD